MSNILLLIIREVPLKGPTKAILKSLADFANNKTHLTIPSYKTLAKDVGCSRRTAITCIKKLVDLNLITKEKRKVNDRQTSNYYYFNIYLKRCYGPLSCCRSSRLLVLPSRLTRVERHSKGLFQRASKRALSKGIHKGSPQEYPYEGHEFFQRASSIHEFLTSKYKQIRPKTFKYNQI